MPPCMRVPSLACKYNKYNKYNVYNRYNAYNRWLVAYPS